MGFACFLAWIKTLNLCMCECKFVCSSVCVTVSNRSWPNGLIHQGFHLASVKTWLWEILTVLVSPLLPPLPSPSPYNQKNLKNVSFFLSSKYDALGFCSHPFFSGFKVRVIILLVFLQTSIYRTAVKYLTSFFSTSFWLESIQSCQIISHPYGNTEQKKVRVFLYHV